ncbi:MAG: DUF6382 domain-containing protein [Bilifractor sp.]
MRIESSRDMFHNYRILSEGRTPERNSYTIRMLTDNRIPGFLDCKIREVDTEMKFLYDVTSLQSLEDMLVTEKVSGKFLELLYASLIRAIKNLEEFLLDEQGILLSPELIFMNAERTSLFFIYYPDQDHTFSEQLRSLGEKILPHLDHSDKQSVIMGYAFYQRTVDDDFSPETLHELLEGCQDRRQGREVSDGEAEEGNCEQREQRERILDEFFNEEDTADEDGIFARLRTWFRRRKQKESGGDPGTGRMSREEQTGVQEVPEHYPDDVQNRRQSRGKESIHSAEMDRQNVAGSLVVRDDGAETMLLADKKKQGEEKAILAKLLPDQEAAGPEYKSRQVRTEPFDLWKPHHILGKSRKSSDLVLEVPTVSRIHARFVQKEDGYHIIDMNSKNGTFLNERMLMSGESCLLHHGDRIRFSDQSFVYHYE